MDAEHAAVGELDDVPAAPHGALPWSSGRSSQFVAAIRMGHEELDPGSDLEGGSVPRPVTAATRHPAHEAIDEPCRTWEAAAEYHDHPITKNTMAAIRTGTFA